MELSTCDPCTFLYVCESSTEFTVKDCFAIAWGEQWEEAFHRTTFETFSILKQTDALLHKLNVEARCWQSTAWRPNLT